MMGELPEIFVDWTREGRRAGGVGRKGEEEESKV